MEANNHVFLHNLSCFIYSMQLSRPRASGKVFHVYAVSVDSSRDVKGKKIREKQQLPDHWMTMHSK